MVAAKFGLFGNNIETTGIQGSELGAICLRTHMLDEAGGAAWPRPELLFPDPKSWAPELSVEGP